MLMKRTVIFYRINSMQARTGWGKGTLQQLSPLLNFALIYPEVDGGKIIGPEKFRYSALFFR